ncbi:hypothetical protein VTJ04DRAFT_9669 [Mycothermus thermophilus]|uniref:uncharacterized protein n=1 Tax=Humicola insolens TaxID=85995 RepID=UPI003742D0D8
MASAENLEIVPDDVEFGMVLEEAENDEDYEDTYIPRIRNYGKVQHRKFTGYDQKLPMVIYGYREETVHGTSQDGVPHSLIVFRWALQQRKPGRRFKAATIKVTFQTERRKPNSKGGGIDAFYDPNVVAVEPNGTYSMVETPVEITKTRSVEAGVEAGVEFAKATAGVTYELSTTVTAVDQIRIVGTERNEYDENSLDSVGDPDRCNVAEWRLFENAATKSGLPTFFRTAVLLERRRGDKSRFIATFEIRAQIDDITDAMIGIKRFFGRVPKDDPIIFDPTVDEKGRLSEFKDRLDTVPLNDECKFVMFQVKEEKE